ncbi:hypothetical protein SKC37_08135 [Aquirufa sp. HETE-83D]|uniref:Glycosyltransferase n=1 Tax=Aquirufa esocilacus TaxID=3096513 RepID=A0ABW6DIW4_9BACT
MIKIAGLVVIYNSDYQDVFKNIYTYLPELDRLYIFDNSDNGSDNELIYNSISEKVVYVSFLDNMGIAFALNYFCKIAILDGYKYLLTMDQDSSFSIGDFKDYLTELSVIDDLTAIIAPLYFGEDSDNYQFYTSGSIINLNIWNQVSGFDENLFIDEVDGDFTFRVLQFGYKLKKSNSIVLNHLLGTKKSKTIFGRHFTSDNHSFIRKYYIARNRVYLIKNRREVFWLYFKDSFVKLLNMIIVEDNLLLKFNYILRGVIDGLFNNMGKINL